MNQLKEKIQDELLSPLNPVQKDAVVHEHGPMLILAGAGSGKTRVITHRIAYLCRIRDVEPHRIAAVTFTNKAAQEMRERLSLLMGPMADQVLVRTFHSLGLYLLRREYLAAGLKSSFTVYDDTAQKTLIKQIIKDMKIPKGLLTPEAVLSSISRSRDALISPQDFETGGDLYRDQTRRIYMEYIKRLRENNAVDYGDLLYESVVLLEKNPEILDKYRRFWSHFLIDEYQDTNKAQYVLGKLITGQLKNIVVVGDDDQSIYSWRGADIENILNFEADYPECKILRLEENYRSTAPILHAASTVIANNSKRREKTLFTKKEGGELPEYRAFDSENEEAEFILARIRSLHDAGMAYKNMAVFYRTNAQSRGFETLFRREGIPHILVGGFRFFDRKEIRDFMAYLSVLVNPADSVSLQRIINVPPRGVGDTSVEKLQDLAYRKGTGLFEALPFSKELSRFRAADTLIKLHAFFLSWREELETGVLPSRIAERILKESGYEESLRSEGTPESFSRLENLQEFISSMREYEEENPEGDLSDFLQSLSLMTSGTDLGDNLEDAVNLMTLHNAKGLEFSVVFFTGFEEGFLPHSLSESEGNTEEERRLVYVGITRARERLYLSGCRFRRIFGQIQPRLPSPFLNELKDSVSRMGGQSSEYSRKPPRAGNYTSSSYRDSGRKATATAGGESFSVGERVFHDKYGEGEVSTVENTVAGQKLGIRFDREPERSRNFLTAYTPLRKI